MDDPGGLGAGVMVRHGLPADEIMRLSQTPEVKGETRGRRRKWLWSGAPFGSPDLLRGRGDVLRQGIGSATSKPKSSPNAPRA